MPLLEDGNQISLHEIASVVLQ